MKSSYFKAAEAMKNSFKKPVHFLYLFRGTKKEKWPLGIAVPYKDFLDNPDKFITEV